MIYANWNRVLYIDLGTNDIAIREPGEGVFRSFLGGYGLGARLLYSWQEPGADPLGPGNHLGFTTGALVGTPAVGATRFTVVGKSPLTGTWGDANSGGYFAAALKNAGFDAVFFRGIAGRPAYLFIEDGQAALHDASEIWGLSAYDAEAALKTRHGPDTQVACIGPAGEKLSLIAGIIHDRGRAAARSGLGAVMGSKKLKAVAVRGTLSVPLADPARSKALRGDINRAFARDESVKYFRKYGTVNHVASSTYSGDAPVKNWAGVGLEDFPTAERISDDNVIRFEARKYACYRCPVACGGIFKVDGAKWEVEATQKPEYETAAMFGSNLLNDDMASIVKANDICNQYGLDTISTAATIAFAFECFEHGLITTADTGGLELNWGDADAIVRLTEMIATREGIGDLLAQGSKIAAEKLGGAAPDYAIHAGGQELAAHDPRYAPTYAVNYATEATPGRHTQTGLTPIELGGRIKGIEIPSMDKYVIEGKGEYNAKLLHLMHAAFSMGLCLFVYGRVDVKRWPEIVAAATGWDYTWDELLEDGARVAAIRQAFNVRDGVPVSQIYVAPRSIGHPPLASGPLRDVSIDLETQKRELYEARGWHPDTGWPTEATLTRLGLEDVARDLY